MSGSSIHSPALARFDDLALAMAAWRRHDGGYSRDGYALFLAWQCGCVGVHHRLCLAVSILDLWRDQPSTCYGYGAWDHLIIVRQCEQFMIFWERGYQGARGPVVAPAFWVPLPGSAEAQALLDREGLCDAA